MRFSIDGFDFEGTVTELKQVIDYLADNDSDIEACEGCEQEAVTWDSEGIPLCQECYDELSDTAHPEGCDCFDEDEFIRTTAAHRCVCVEFGSDHCAPGCCVCKPYGVDGVDDGEGACSFTPDDILPVPVPSVWTAKDHCDHQYEYTPGVGRDLSLTCDKCGHSRPFLTFTQTLSKHDYINNPGITTTTINIPTVCQHRYVYDKDTAMFECFNGCGSTIQ